MKKELNNKGFSLVELIIVIAIMAVLMGVLAPQYLKYVKSSKISTDITNAESIATAINVAVADQAGTTGHDSIAIGTGGSGTDVNVSGGDQIISKANGGTVVAPKVKFNGDWKWFISFDSNNGVKEIKCGAAAASATKIWPDSTDYEALGN